MHSIYKNMARALKYNMDPVQKRARLRQVVPTSINDFPSDILIELLINVEVTVLLTASLESLEIQNILLKDDFWQRKFHRDFPDLTEIVGLSIPTWVPETIPNSRPEKLQWPDFSRWRRYYEVVRYIMSKIHQSLVYRNSIELDEYLRRVGYSVYPHPVDAHLIPGSIHTVEYTLYEREYENERDPETRMYPMRLENVIEGPNRISIWEFCQRFVQMDMDPALSLSFGRATKPNTIRDWLRADARFFHSETLKYFSTPFDENIVRDFIQWVTTEKLVNDSFWLDDMSDTLKILDWVHRRGIFVEQFNRNIKSHLDANMEALKVAAKRGLRGLNEEGNEVLLLGHNICSTCSSKASYKCGHDGCTTLYCGTKCATQDWPTHSLHH